MNRNNKRINIVLISALIVSTTILFGFLYYNSLIDVEQQNTGIVNKIDDKEIEDKALENRGESRLDSNENNTIIKESRAEIIASNIRGEYREIRRNFLRYSPIELPSIPNIPSIPTLPVIPPDTDNGNDTNSPILVSGDRDPSFDTGVPVGFDGGVNTLAIQADGKIIVGGGFTSYQGESANGIIRLNSDGSIDTSFNISDGFDSGTVYTLAIQADGKIIVGGWFNGYQGESANRIIRLNSDGSIDDTFDMGTGFDLYVYTLALQSDGKIIVGGVFSSYQSQPAGYLIRIYN
jgi:uncharacterized delta-60 repeat protein